MSSEPAAADEAFDRLTAARASAVLIVTAAAPSGPVGCLVGFATQCSIEPRHFLVCLSKANHTWHALAASTPVRLGVHLVPAEAESLARRFAGETGDDVDKFTGLAWTPGRGGVPLLDECPDRFVGVEVDRMDVGDHVAVVCAIESVEAGAPRDVVMVGDLADVTPGNPA